MSDPLSIAAGIAGFLSLGIQVTQTLVDFYSVYKSQDKDIAKIAQNIENLQSAFRSLGIAIQQRQSQPNAEGLLQEVRKATNRCHEIIEELQAECQKFSADATITGLKGRFQVAGRRAAYPFRKSTIQKIEEDIGEIRENLSFALNVLQFKNHNRIEDEISTVRSLLERTKSSQISITIRSWLQAPDPSVNHNAISKKHHPDTGLWFINSYQFANWLQERSSFLWLNGFAGCGKSVLCSVAIQTTFRETKHRNKVGIAFFYFSFTDDSKQDEQGMLRALLLQLSVQLQDGEKELEQLRLLSKSSTPSVEALLQTLRKFLERFQDSYILLDALDECPQDNGREGVLRAIEAIRDWSIPTTHLLVTSREQSDIRRSLNPSSNHDISMKNSGIDRDIAGFVSYQLENDPKLQRWKVRYSEIQTKLTQGAQGLNAFRRARNRNQLDECLRSLPRDLDETYERMLCSIDETYVEDVRRILTILCVSTRPHTVEELIDAHAVELSEPPYLDRDGRSYEHDDLVDICLGLIEIVAIKIDDGDPISVVRIAHFSIQEYLQSDRIRQQKAERFAIHSITANTEMTQICLVYLLDPRLSDGVLDEKKVRDFPLAHFAAAHWYHYYRVSQEGKSKAESLILRIFQNERNSFVNWVRFYDIDHPLENYVSFNRGMDDMASPIYYASILGLEATLKSILATYTRSSSLPDIVNAMGGKYGNPLQSASAKGHKEVVQILLDHGADVNAVGGYYGNTPYAASARGHREVVQMLLDHGADANALDALYPASARGYKEVVEILLDKGADVNAQGGYFGNALYAASVAGYDEVVQILLDHGADVNVQDGTNGSVLQAASAEGHKEVVQLLLDHGADVNVNTLGHGFGNALQAASAHGYKEVVQILLDQGADVNAKGGYYGNALYAASDRGYNELVKILLDQGANANAQGGEDGNALHTASAKGHKEVVQLLLNHGANVNALGGYYSNALQAALAKDHKEVAQILLDHGADVNAKGGSMAMHSKPHPLQATKRWSKYFSIKVPTYDNALQAASSAGHKYVVQILLDHGADVNAKGGFYGSAVRAASAWYHKEVVRMLLDHGAITSTKPPRI
ncbi:hypothetical protein N7510_008395 [Penicillium lagena]|uniref:uncharacterized protein n=1 Tax=Penicillium lagena TaxID=94218 RepID=UPI0025415720|nr:uncharacterized protein N7510_008395 [Penicillium lagena]KAJ5605614.1 hypothetical protein N7510_008395 [Penicillium lagena]